MGRGEHEAPRSGCRFSVHVRCYCILVANHDVGVKVWQENTWGVESVRSANVMGSRYLYTEGPAT